MNVQCEMVTKKGKQCHRKYRFSLFGALYCKPHFLQERNKKARERKEYTRERESEINRRISIEDGEDDEVSLGSFGFFACGI